MGGGGCRRARGQVRGKTGKRVPDQKVPIRVPWKRARVWGTCLPWEALRERLLSWIMSPLSVSSSGTWPTDLLARTSVRIGAMCAHTCTCTRAYMCVTGKRNEGGFAELAAQLSTVRMYLLARYSRHYLDSQIPLQLVAQKRKRFSRKEALHKVWPLQLASWVSDLRARPSAVQAPSSLQAAAPCSHRASGFPPGGCLLEQTVWYQP